MHKQRKELADEASKLFSFLSALPLRCALHILHDLVDDLCSVKRFLEDFFQLTDRLNDNTLKLIKNRLDVLFWNDDHFCSGKLCCFDRHTNARRACLFGMARLSS